MLKEIVHHPIYGDIVRSSAFRRLKGISFLGAIDYISDQHKRDNRYRHSLSVGGLALLYSRIRYLEQADQHNLVTAALLHDIGHGPLSHSMESAFIEKFGLSHHVSTASIIMGTSPLGLEIPEILKRHNLDRDHILFLIQGLSKDKVGFALSNPINLDTADAILRTFHYFPTPLQEDYHHFSALKPTDVVKALVDKNHDILDRFWNLKDIVYASFIQNKLNLFVDFIMASHAMKNDLLETNDFFLTDNLYAKKYSVFFNHLFRKYRQELFSHEIKFYKKNCQIVKEKKITDDYSIFNKYKYTKHLCTAVIPGNVFLPLSC